MKIVELLKSFFNKWKSSEVETILVSKKQCPNCVNRGMYIFNTNHKHRTENESSNENN